jgi:hypothetical protein
MHKYSEVLKSQKSDGTLYSVPPETKKLTNTRVVDCRGRIFR